MFQKKNQLCNFDFGVKNNDRTNYNDVILEIRDVKTLKLCLDSYLNFYYKLIFLHLGFSIHGAAKKWVFQFLYQLGLNLRQGFSAVYWGPWPVTSLLSPLHRRFCVFYWKRRNWYRKRLLSYLFISNFLNPLFFQLSYSLGYAWFFSLNFKSFPFTSFNGSLYSSNFFTEVNFDSL